MLSRSVIVRFLPRLCVLLLQCSWSSTLAFFVMVLPISTYSMWSLRVPLSTFICASSSVLLQATILSALFVCLFVLLCSSHFVGSFRTCSYLACLYHIVPLVMRTCLFSSSWKALFCVAKMWKSPLAKDHVVLSVCPPTFTSKSPITIA